MEKKLYTVVHQYEEVCSNCMKYHNTLYSFIADEDIITGDLTNIRELNFEADEYEDNDSSMRSFNNTEILLKENGYIYFECPELEQDILDGVIKTIE